MKNLRVFRRNSQKTIIVWDSDPDYVLRDIVLDKISLNFEENTEVISKLSSKVKAINIPHESNNLNPFEDYKIKFIFTNKKNGEDVVVEKNIYSINNKKADIKAKELRVYGYDYENDKWIPLPVDISLIRKGK